MSKVETIGPQRAAELIEQGAVLIDIREATNTRARTFPAPATTRCRRSRPAIRRARATAC